LEADGYIHGRLGWHLERAGDIEGLHALLREETAEGRNGWCEANERLGQATHFADCVAQAWRLVDEAFRQGGPTLGLQCRCALLSASLNSLAGNLPPALLEALVRQRLWPMEQALANAQRTPNAGQKVEALARLAELAMPGERAAVLGQALEAAHSLGDGWDRSWALAALAPHLPERERAAVLGQALDAARSLGNEEARSRALAALAPRLATLPLRDLSTIWTQTLPVLAARTRRNFSHLQASAQNTPSRDSVARPTLSAALEGARSVASREIR
jgi:hypothetical protein